MSEHKDYAVLVENIGTVYTGNKATAYEMYEEYVNQSKSKHGRTGGEGVVLFCDGEIEQEFFGFVNSEEG